eukprot:CAMPEP_0172521594 /NCGR_PEP_ID=MMETSP1066-20121228/292672_1 /TAXON_ID=671091 /ORGANISM="Coscinodiscus wailesii, Strain CCMP2513" /LENGTH=86 /DNA_ID=CAMNT_0013304529 /DNA_START=127 /DNA_END=387 /DNA_ORIENTATION=+
MKGPKPNRKYPRTKSVYSSSCLAGPLTTKSEYFSTCLVALPTILEGSDTIVPQNTTAKTITLPMPMLMANAMRELLKPSPAPAKLA